MEVRVGDSWITNQLLDTMNQKFVKLPFLTIFFPKYDKWIRLNQWIERSKKKIAWNVLHDLKLRRYPLTWKIIKTLHVYIGFVNITKLALLWRKLEFYTEVNKKDVSFVAL